MKIDTILAIRNLSTALIIIGVVGALVTATVFDQSGILITASMGTVMLGGFIFILSSWSHCPKFSNQFFADKKVKDKTKHYKHFTNRCMNCESDSNTSI